MDKLIEDSNLDCPPDQQIKILERCLQIVTTPGENMQKKDIGYLLLSRVIERCSAECLRAAQTRLGKRLVDIADGPTLSSAIFVRQLLAGELHANTVEKIIISLLDQAIREDYTDIKELAAEIFSLRYGCSKSHVVLSTIEILLRQKLISVEERQGLLDLPSLGMSQYMEALPNYLFHVLSTSFNYCRQGELLDRDKFFTVIELGINNPAIRDAALETLESFCRTAKKAALPVIPMIASMLISHLNNPSAALFSALHEISQQHGPGSTLFKHFYVIFEVMKHPLDRQDYANEAERLISSIVRTSSFLIQPEILISVQQKICREYAANPSSPVYRSLIASFLANTHPLIPPPVQAARTMLKRYPDETISSLCDIITRPRLMSLDTTRALEKATTLKIQEHTISAKSSNIPAEDEHRKQVDSILEEIRQVTAAPKSIPEEELFIEEPQPAPPKIETPVKKRQTEERTPVPVVKKPKKPEPQTVLHEGEQSVDDIFDSFVI